MGILYRYCVVCNDGCSNKSYTPSKAWQNFLAMYGYDLHNPAGAAWYM